MHSLPYRRLCPPDRSEQWLKPGTEAVLRASEVHVLEPYLYNKALDSLDGGRITWPYSSTAVSSPGDEHVFSINVSGYCTESQARQTGLYHLWAIEEAARVRFLIDRMAGHTDLHDALSVQGLIRYTWLDEALIDPSHQNSQARRYGLVVARNYGQYVLERGEPGVAHFYANMNLDFAKAWVADTDPGSPGRKNVERELQMMRDTFRHFFV